MANATLNATFNGTTPVTRLSGDDPVEWFDARIGHYSAFHQGGFLDANATLVGADWTVAYLQIAGDDNLTRIVDGDQAGGRRIGLLTLGFNSDVDLRTTSVDYVFGWDGDSHDVTLGTSGRSVRSVNLFAAENKLTTSGDFVRSVETGGKDTILIGSGGAGYIETGDGNAALTTLGYVEAVTTRGGDDVLKIGGGAASVSTRDGADVVRVTGNSQAEFIATGTGNDKVYTGNGGAGLVRTQDGNDLVQTGSGFVNIVETSGGNDRVVTSTSYVQYISTGDDNDLVKMGKGGGSQVNLGNGDDRVIVNAAPEPFYLLDIWGGTGTDTIDFKPIKQGVTFDLGESGGQNLTVPGGDPLTDGIGVVRVVSMENAFGTGGNDALTGSARENKLVGRGGNDRLEGKEGDDLLIGNKGRDTFVFGQDGSTDSVKGFNKKQDSIEIAGNAGGFKTLDISKAGKHLQIDYDDGTILLLGKAALGLTAADFDFV